MISTASHARGLSFGTYMKISRIIDSDEIITMLDLADPKFKPDYMDGDFGVPSELVELTLNKNIEDADIRGPLCLAIYECIRIQFERLAHYRNFAPIEITRNKDDYVFDAVTALEAMAILLGVKDELRKELSCKNIEP